jgi:hypothetical protein
MKLVSFAAAALLAFAASGRASPVAYKTVDVDGIKVFYREAGPADAPVLLLLHGFPTSSHMYRDLMPKLAGELHFFGGGHFMLEEYSAEVATLIRRFLHEQIR